MTTPVLWHYDDTGAAADSTPFGRLKLVRRIPENETFWCFYINDVLITAFFADGRNAAINVVMSGLENKDVAPVVQPVVKKQSLRPISWYDTGEDAIEGVHPLGTFVITPTTLNGKYPLHYVIRFNGRHMECADTVEEAKMASNEHIEGLIRQSFVEEIVVAIL